MAGKDYQTGVFPSGLDGSFQGGPIALFDADLNTVVMSSMSYFISVVASVDSSNALNVGIQGQVTNLPQNFKFEYVMYLDQGINTAFMGWGDVLLSRCLFTNGRTQLTRKQQMVMCATH